MPPFVLATFNANSIRQRIGIVQEWLRAHQPDALCIQETKVQDHDFPAAAFTEVGYHVVFRGMKAYNGVAIASKEPAQDVLAGLDDGGEPDEPRLLSAVFRGIRIVNTYVPQGFEPDSPKFQYKLEWYRRLRAWFERHGTPEIPLIWTGDFNVAPEEMDVYDPKGLLGHVCFCPQAWEALAGVREWGFTDIFRKHHPEPGHFTYFDFRAINAVKRKIGWRIDHIYGTRPVAETSEDSWIDLEPRMKEKPSDHTFLAARFAWKE